MPEGWGFFTKNPREPYVDVLKKKDGIWQSCLALPNSATSNFFGLSRKTRSQGMEYGKFQGELSGVKWFENKSGTLNQILLDTLIAIPVSNPYQSPDLCGKIILVKKEMVPWAWSQSYESVKMPVRFIKLDIACL